MSQSAEQRFWKYVKKTKGCWEWTAYKNARGYGQITINKQTIVASRFSYELLIGPIPEGLCVLHTCDNPSCVNPKHLWLGTREDNIHDMEEKGRGVHNGTPGEKHPMAKLNWKKVNKIRKMYNAGKYFQKELAKIFSVTRSNISCIVRKNSWKNI